MIKKLWLFLLRWFFRKFAKNIPQPVKEVVNEADTVFDEEAAKTAQRIGSSQPPFSQGPHLTNKELQEKSRRIAAQAHQR